MRRILYAFFGICILLIGPTVTWAGSMRTPAARAIPASPLVEYDRGTKNGARQFQSVAVCAPKPCVVTQYGAWRFAPEVVGAYRIAIGYVHAGGFREIGLFQESTSLEQKLGERLLNRYPNRAVVNLTRLVETGAAPIVYMYGVLLQNEMSEGDPIVVALTSLADQTIVHEYFFRYHKVGSVPDIDLSLLYPIDFFHPNPNNTIQGATAGAAFSFSVGSNMDPDLHYGWIRKIMRAVRFNLFLGLLTRKELTPIAGDLVVRDAFDGFGGAGITLFDFLNVGYGVNFVRTPHSAFPFVGLEVRHVFDFLRSLKRDTHTRWEKYLEEEKFRQ